MEVSIIVSFSIFQGPSSSMCQAYLYPRETDALCSQRESEPWHSQLMRWCYSPILLDPSCLKGVGICQLGTSLCSHTWISSSLVFYQSLSSQVIQDLLIPTLPQTPNQLSAYSIITLLFTGSWALWMGQILVPHGSESEKKDPSSWQQAC